MAPGSNRAGIVSHPNVEIYMRLRGIGITMGLMLGIASLPLTHAAKAETGTGSTYKWVDANGDCRSTCDNSKFACPCVIGP